MLFLSLALFSLLPLFAQERQNEELTQEQKIERCVAKVRGKLMLSDEDAEAFATVYREYLKELIACRSSVRCSRKDMTDKDIKAFIEACMEAKQRSLDIDRKYYAILSKMLNARQLQVVFRKYNWHNNGRSSRNSSFNSPSYPPATSISK